jgi:Leucine-rich repeat (LRR) protein/tRNA A-37 threonylcarbamoyl transferase component Bud32
MSQPRPCPNPASQATSAQQETPSPEGAPAGYDFLAPPQQAGEVGRLGPYRVLGLLGQGAMALVFRAEETDLKRREALKVLRPALAGNALARQRFLREAQVAAALEHEHIVSIHRVGEDRGLPYLAMPLLQGETLEARLARQGRLPLAEVLRVGREVAEGLAAAHGRGLMHRDIKPANVWLEDLGERGASAPRYRVKILDLGLARAVEDDALLTQAGALVSTPLYMAPEQAEGKAVDQRCDLYSLGCVLYRTATGRVPLQADDAAGMLDAVLYAAPRPAAELNPELPPALSDLVMALLAKDPAARPAAAQVALALSALERVPPPAPPAGRLPGRVRRLWAAAAVLLAALAAAGYLFGPDLVRFAANQARLEINADDPDIQVQVVQGGRVLRLDLAAGREIDLPPGTYEIKLPEGRGDLRPEPDTVTLARGGRQAVRVYRIPGFVGEIARLRGHTDAVTSVAVSPDGRRALSGSADRTMRLWDLAAGKELRRFEGHEMPVSSVAFSPDGRRALSGSWVGVMRLWDVETGKELRRFEGHTSWVNSVAFSPDGARALSGGGEGSTARLWDLATGRELRRFGHANFVVRAIFSPDGRRVLSAGLDGTVRLWDAGTGQELRHFGVSAAFGILAFSRDGHALCGTNHDKGMSLWDVATGQEVVRLPGHAGDLALSPDGRRALTTGGDSSVCLWDLARGKELARLRGHEGGVSRVAFSPDGRRALSAGQDRTVRLWSLPPPAPGAGPGDEAWVKAVAALPAEEQVREVAARLKERNPGFGGKVTPKIADGVVTGLQFLTDEVTDVAPLRALPGLKQLWCNGSDVGKGKLADLGPLRGLSLDYLDCMRTRVVSLAPLKGMPLTRLYCAHTQVADLGPLRGMPLTGLWCDDTQVADLAPLRDMPLRILIAGNTRVTTLAPLDGSRLSRLLTELDCSQTGVTSLAPLKGMLLKRLTCSRTAVADLTPLKGMFLDFLHCQDTRVADLAPLRYVPLTELHCAHTPITSLGPLKGLPLAWLSCNTTRVADLAPLKGMPLKHLDCGDTRVTDLGPLRGMALEQLDCYNTPVSDLGPLRGMPLRILHAGNTRVADLSPLKGLRLTVFYCNGTLVTDLTPLRGVPLHELWCDFKPARDAQVLRSIRTLELLNNRPTAALWKELDARRPKGP